VSKTYLNEVSNCSLAIKRDIMARMRAMVVEESPPPKRTCGYF